MTQTDEILSAVYAKIKITDRSAEIKYKHIDVIVSELQKRHKKASINSKTTGTISERLCELALKSRVPDVYKRISNKWNWMADFSVLGHPFNLLISVKSFKARERLLVSGSGSVLSPTVGWGLLNDTSEWTEPRTRAYLFRGFIAIYIPTSTYKNISKEARDIKNINAKPLLRKIDSFTEDLKNSLDNGVIDITAF